MLQTGGRFLLYVPRSSHRLHSVHLTVSRMAATTCPRPRTRSKPPLVAVIGTTGVGKTDLGVELALALRQSRSTESTPTPTTAQVINHDSMQCYRGLDTITNKATEEEMRGVPHHLMGFLEPGQDWSVNDFLRDALARASALRLFEKTGRS